MKDPCVTYFRTVIITAEQQGGALTSFNTLDGGSTGPACVFSAGSSNLRAVTLLVRMPSTFSCQVLIVWKEIENTTVWGRYGLRSPALCATHGPQLPGHKSWETFNLFMTLTSTYYCGHVGILASTVFFGPYGQKT